MSNYNRIRFLNSFISSLRTKKHVVVTDTQQRRGASVSILLRLKSNETNTIPISNVLYIVIIKQQSFSECLSKYLKTSIDMTNGDLTVQVLFAKKSQRGKRRGEVCFPGGHLEKGESPLDAVEREAQEEAGLNLKDIRNYSLLGRLDDRITFDQLVLYTFDDFGWVDIDHFLTESSADSKWSPIIEFHSLTSMSQRRIVNPILKSLFRTFRVPVTRLPIQTSTFNLWGLSLELTSELVKTVVKSSNIPSIEESNNRIMYHIFHHPIPYLALLAVSIPTAIYFIATNNKNKRFI
ncbi:hypothetical protein PPL_05933 [Heterostelium album PN500]|uniref:Nudix hydrolase domain-containing protein n=1 Tax=Heterostelium pallidum (strain ATCC 26659 / Pp 5 / PN500) TaxID=670386 RepID=D3BBR4_HETP5|nr:hypothetical protein PPL_05933 [Heterostelium album PN500]EFA81097.1 hypothetical protein PPL_05933 [Heterostelium album PN500]|eukprot:XP_020433215.1 hypothetical protein PPL_05933 [Heterostelium album PN500]